MTFKVLINKSLFLSQRRLGFDRPPYLWLFIFWLFTLIISLIGLGNLPLRDFDEATVARVSFELSQKQGWEFLLPTIWDVDYLNKPPGIHWLIASLINFNNRFNSGLVALPSELTIRLIPSILSTFVVPLGGLIQWHLRPNDNKSAITTTAILMTTMPIIRHGRLAMLDGAQLSAMALLWLLLVSFDNTYLDRIRSLLVGLSCSFLLLLKAPFVIPAMASGCISIFWTNNFRFVKRNFLIGFFLIGISPGIAWHLWHAIQRGEGALWLWGSDGAVRVLFDAGEGSDLGFLVPLIEFLEGGWPWLLLWPFGIMWAWMERNSKWGKWILSTQLVLLPSIFLLKTQLPWYSHPLWLPFAMTCGKPLAWLINRDNLKDIFWKRILGWVPFAWRNLGFLLICLGILSCFRFFPFINPYRTIILSAGIGWGLGGWLLTRSLLSQRFLGSISVVCGSYFSLLLLMSSTFWLWEINENWSVKPIAEMVSQYKKEEIFISGSHERPSLNWYSGKRIQVLKDSQNPNWFITRESLSKINNIYDQSCKIVEEVDQWALLFCNDK